MSQLLEQWGAGSARREGEAEGKGARDDPGDSLQSVEGTAVIADAPGGTEGCAARSRAGYLAELDDEGARGDEKLKLFLVRESQR